MAFGAVRSEPSPDAFARLHRLFVTHFAIALGFVWAAALVAALHAPWVRNIRGLIDPLGRPEGTGSFLFGLPVLMSAAWLCAAFGRDIIRRSQLLKHPEPEFVLAGLVAFAVFCMAINRAVVAFLLGA
ncbi:MAG: hypothetical protein JWR08_282 [Enterovirga sp.]|jgi:hypothetical protein|nr:hypothetical protein [Enterovirga sp.]